MQSSTEESYYIDASDFFPGFRRRRPAPTTLEEAVSRKPMERPEPPKTLEEALERSMRRRLVEPDILDQLVNYFPTPLKKNSRHGCLA